MKQTVLLIAAIFSMALVCNATNDTVTVIDQPGQVIITETPTGVKVDVVGSKDNAQRIYTYTVEHDADDKVIKIFSGFKSLNIMFLLCKYSKIWTTCPA